VEISLDAYLIGTNYPPSMLLRRFVPVTMVVLACAIASGNSEGHTSAGAAVVVTVRPTGSPEPLSAGWLQSLRAYSEVQSIICAADGRQLMRQLLGVRKPQVNQRREPIKLQAI